MNTDPIRKVVIVGGGMVGASLAIALSGRGLRLAIVEAYQPGADSQPSYDDRGIALARAHPLPHRDNCGSHAPVGIRLGTGNS